MYNGSNLILEKFLSYKFIFVLLLITLKNIKINSFLLTLENICALIHLELLKALSK